MRIPATALVLFSLLMIPVPVQADHDPNDRHRTVDLGDDRVWYLDDSFPPMIYREDNGIRGFQRGSDGSGHPSHANPDERVF